MPSRVSVNPNLAPDSAMTRSATAHRPMPPPSAAPWTRAITGTGHVSIASNISAIAIASCSLPSTSRDIAARIQSMSAPAQNVWPSPASTTARRSVAESRSSAANAARSSAISEASNALCRSGRASVTRATTPPGSGPLDAQALAHRSCIVRAGQRPRPSGRRDGSRFGHANSRRRRGWRRLGVRPDRTPPRLLRAHRRRRLRRRRGPTPSRSAPRTRA